MLRVPLPPVAGCVGVGPVAAAAGDSVPTRGASVPGLKPPAGATPVKVQATAIALSHKAKGATGVETLQLWQRGERPA